jgi:hypothetical protein
VKLVHCAKLFDNRRPIIRDSVGAIAIAAIACRCERYQR